MDDKPPRPSAVPFRFNPKMLEPEPDPLHQQWYRAVHDGHKTTTWWGRLLERLRFGRAARRGLIWTPPVEPTGQLLSPSQHLRWPVLDESTGELDLEKPPTSVSVPADAGYHAFLRTLPDLTVQQVLEANEAAQLVALVGIADPEQRAGFWGKIRFRWWWRRLRRRLGYTSRPRPHGRLQRTRSDFPG